MATSLTANHVYRDKSVPGVYSSPDHDPKKSEIRELLTWYESAIQAGMLSDAVWKETKAALTADLAHDADTLGVVYADSTSANNGLYKKNGGSGSGSWTQITTFLPGYQFVTAVDDGTSTANAYSMDTSPRLPAGDGVALISFVVPETNAATTVTVSFDGGTAKTIKTASGNDPTIGGLVQGMPVLGIVVGGEFLMRSDQTSAAIQAAAESAADRAEQAAADAQAAAGSTLPTMVNVKGFGAVVDGTTDDTAAIQAAVASAFAYGQELYLDGEALVTGSISNFHNVKWRGPGRIKRGTDTFHVDIRATEANRMYVATTGSDTNDGLSSDQPFATVQAAANALRNYGPFLDGIWYIHVAAGTYTPGAQTTLPFLGARERIQIYGPDVGGHPNVPTAVFDGAGSALSAFAATSSRYLFKDIKLVNWLSAPGGGIVGQVGADIYTWNVHTDNCTNGVKMGGGGNLFVNGGRYNNGVNGIACVSNVTFTVGYGASELAEGTIILGNSSAGVYAAENCAGHVDYTTMDGNGYGIDATTLSRVNSTLSRIANNAIGVRAREGSEWFNNQNTLTGNTIDMIHGANSSELTVHGNAYAGPVKAAVRTNISAHTGTTSRTVLASLYTLPVTWFTDNSKKLVLRVYGTYTTATGAEYVGIAFGGTHAIELQSSGTPPGGAVFRAEIEVTPLSRTQQRVTGLLYQGNAVVRNVNTTINFSTLDDGGTTVDLTATLAAAGDSLAVNMAELYLEG